MTALALAALLICAGAFASGADAASPAWKVLAATAPTNLPPVQSETQRVTVEAEGGTFGLAVEAGEGRITPVTREALVDSTEGSPVLTIVEGSFEVGARVLAGGLPFGENFVVGCSPDCETPGSTVTMSVPAESTTVAEFALISPKQATVLDGDFPVGTELVATGAEEIFLPGTMVTAVSGSTINLSQPPSVSCVFCENVSTAAVQHTPLIAFDASQEALQSALDSLPGLSGAITVTGGPGGSAEHPYFLDFGGPFADREVASVVADEAGLTPLHHTVRIFTTVPGGPGTGEITVDPANLGGVEMTGEHTVEVGPLPEGVVTRGVAHGEGWTCSEEEVSVTCTSEEAIRSLFPSPNVLVPIEVTTPEAFEGSVPVTVSGSGAAAETITIPIKVSSKPASFGIAALWAGSFDANGEPEVQAGGHPYSADTFFLLNTIRHANGTIATPGDPRTVKVDLPPGFTGDPLNTPRCLQSQLVPAGEPTQACTLQSRVGRFMASVTEFGNASATFTHPIWNDVPAQGYAAEFATEIASPVQNLLASLRSSGDYGIRITAFNNPNYAAIFGAFAALEGFPGGGGGKPFLTNATSCSENARSAPTVTAEAQTWQEPDVRWPATSAILPAAVNCAALQFTPGFTLQPTATAGSSGTGATAALHISQEGLTDPAKLATPDLKKAVVTLPAGLTLNASSANGLQACSEAQMGLLTTTGELPNPIRFDEEPVTCPDGSKLGTVQIKTPLLDETEPGGKLEGTIYLAEQEHNPFQSLLALYLVVENARYGITLKLPGEIQAEPSTGQLSATFDHNPQVPFEDLTLNFRGGGPRSELSTPEVCGHYSTGGSLEPWSAPESGPPAQISEGGFDVTTGCSSSAATRPFAPSFEAGTTGTQAGAYSPLVIKVTRKDGEQELKSLDFTLPKGLVGKLAGIPYCPDAAIQQAEGKSGKAEQASPSCPAASAIGTVDTAAGVGTEPFHVGGKVYLAGPYKGAPLSSVVITPAVAGPFDLGDVVIRAPLYVNPETAQITAKSDPIPTILKGIPLKLRSVAINLDRPNFGLNPTSCDVMAVTASLGSSNGASAAPSNRFQVGGCKKLAFKPRLALRVFGKTNRNAKPRFRAVLRTKPGEANIARAQVNLPHSEFLEQSHIRTICTRVQFNAGAGHGEQCPKGSIYGHAKAFTPLLDKPIQGPVYLRSSNNKLPDLVAALNGQIDIDLDGKIDSGKNAGIRNTFEVVPDAPVSKFILEMKGGKKGLLVNSEDLCSKTGKRRRAIARFTGQNGKVHTFKPKVANDCGKAKPKKNRHPRKGGK